MINTKTFADFLGLGLEKIEAKKSVGIVVCTKVLRVDQPLTIPQGTKFTTASGFTFFSTEQVEISESATFAPVPVQAQTAGADANIAENDTWASPQISGISVQNPRRFSQGADAVPERKGIYPGRQKNLGPTDTQLQAALDVAKPVIHGMLGLEDTEDLDETDPRIVQSVFMLAMYRMEQNSSQERRYAPPGLHSTSPQVTHYWRSNVYKNLMNQISGLLQHKINFKRMINGENETAQTA